MPKAEPGQHEKLLLKPSSSTTITEFQHPLTTLSFQADDRVGLRHVATFTKLLSSSDESQ